MMDNQSSDYPYNYDDGLQSATATPWSHTLPAPVVGLIVDRPQNAINRRQNAVKKFDRQLQLHFGPTKGPNVKCITLSIEAEGDQLWHSLYTLTTALKDVSKEARGQRGGGGEQGTHLLNSLRTRVE